VSNVASNHQFDIVPACHETALLLGGAAGQPPLIEGGAREDELNTVGNNAGIAGLPETVTGTLPHALGPVTQLGFVVRDVEAAMQHWINVFGAAPFLCIENGPSRPLPVSYMRGEASSVDIKFALGYLGDLQIELIEQRNSAPSPYREFLDAGREGLQHFDVQVNDYEKAVSLLKGAGYRSVYEIRVAEGLPIAYYESPSFYGPMVELVPPKWRKSRQAVRAATRRWSGGDPIIRYDTYTDFLKAEGVVFA